MGFVYEEISNRSKHGKPTFYTDVHSSSVIELKDIRSKVVGSMPENSYFRGIKTFIFEAFFPEGYPDSVSNDYLTYQAWDTLQAFASSISGSLATKAVLEGVGVGDGNATALAATITWLLRQGAGMISQILFTWMQGSDLDHNCKKWRLFADILNDSAMCLELSGPLWPSFLIQFVLCFASVARSLVGVAGGATRTAITQHQAKAGNISDVAAKDGSQETLVNLLALLVNLTMLPLVAENMTLTWFLFFGLTVLHLFANFKAVSSLCFQTLNRDRLILAIQSYNSNNKKVIDNPEEINKKENVLIGFGLSENDLFKHLPEYSKINVKIDIGVPLTTIVSLPHENPDNEHPVIEQMKKDLSDFNFSIIPDVRDQKCHRYNVLLSSKFKKEKLLHVYFIAYKMTSSTISLTTSESVKKYEQEYTLFEEKLIEAGWKTEQLQLNTMGFTGNFLQ